MASIYNGVRCRRCFRRLPIQYLKGGLCCGCREEVGLPVQKIIIPPFLEEHKLKMFIFNDNDDEYTVFADNKRDAEKHLLEYLGDIDCPNSEEASSLEDLDIYYSVDYEVIEGEVLLRSLR